MTTTPETPSEDQPVEQVNKRKGKPDRWAHRRGEPRVFAFMWTLYLLAATLLGFGSLGAVGAIHASTYRTVARIILVTVSVGIVVVWPMTRLSQVKPARNGVRLAWADFVVVVLTIQAVVVPQVFLPFGWSKSIVIAISLILSAWIFAVAGLLAVALRPGSRRAAQSPPVHGWLWMLVIILLTFAIPAGLLVSTSSGTAAGTRSGTSNEIRRAWLASPVTGVYELTRRRPHTSIAPVLDRNDWIVIGSPAAIGAVFWLVALGFRSRDE